MLGQWKGYEDVNLPQLFPLSAQLPFPGPPTHGAEEYHQGDTLRGAREPKILQPQARGHVQVFAGWDLEKSLAYEISKCREKNIHFWHFEGEP